MGEEMSFSQHTRDTINGWGSVLKSWLKKPLFIIQIIYPIIQRDKKA